MSSTTPPVHKSGAFDMDDKAILRAAVVVGGIAFIVAMYFVIRCYRNTRSSRSRIRKYDIVSAKDLQQPSLLEDSESDDDLFGSMSDRQKLVSAGSGNP